MAKLFGVAQLIVCCSEIGGKGSRREIFQRGVGRRWFDLVGDLRLREQALVKQLVSHTAIEALAKATLHGLAGRAKCQLIFLSRAYARMAFEVIPCRVGDNHARLAARFDRRRQLPRHTSP